MHLIYLQLVFIGASIYNYLDSDSVERSFEKASVFFICAVITQCAFEIVKAIKGKQPKGGSHDQ